MKTKKDQRLRTTLAVLFVFFGFALMGLLFGYGRGGNSTSIVGSEICKATCMERGWQNGLLVSPSDAASGGPHGPKTCECR
ncbi:hypothetical protein [Variovorax boronicumulans]|uniref:hypothetical protein n=1 Tax=Variovorax boronicumulans TaxID=436515 RepID=UPI0033987DC0